MHRLLLKREDMYPMLMAVLLLYVRNGFLTSYLLLLATLTESLRGNHRLNHRFHSGNASTFVTFDSLWTSAFSSAARGEEPSRG